MSLPGWYPDPGGRPGHFRHWDGQQWSQTTTPDPSSPPPAPPGGSPRSPLRPRRRRTGLWIAVVAALVVLAVVGVLVLRDQRAVIVDGGPVPSATVSGGDDTTPTPSFTPSPSPTEPTSSPTARQSPPPSAQPCPIGDPLTRQDHPNDGRVHGGGLSFPRQSGWTDPGVQTDEFTWAYDVGETDTKVQPQWYAAYAVGALSVADGFEDPQSAAELSLRCTLGSDLYRNVIGQPEVVERQTTIDGYPAFTIAAQVRVDDPRTTFDGDTVVITVVDLGSPEALAFFWGCAPIDDTTLGPQLDRVSKQLQVD